MVNVLKECNSNVLKAQKGEPAVTYCGIDMGKLSSHFCLVDAKRKVLEEDKVRNTEAALRKAFGKRPPMRICIEASTKSFWMADRLRELGHTVVVVDPGKTKAIGAGLIKNDKLDARVLATLSQADLMAAVDQPVETERLARMMVVARDGLVRSRVILMVMVRSLLDSEGGELRHATAEGFPAAVKELLPTLPPSMAAALEPLVKGVEDLSIQVARCDKALEAAARKNPTTRLLMTAPGVGVIVASCFVNAIRDPKRFETSRDVGAYLGLVPRLYQSGTTNRKGGITKHGNRQARWALSMAANNILACTRWSSALREWGLKLAKKRGRKKAVVAVARKLAGILWAMWKNQKEFEARLPKAKAA
jgi:transposase